MKAVILTGNQANQKALCHKLAKVCDVAAIVISDNILRRQPTISRRAQTLLNRIGNRLVGRPFVESWFQMLDRYNQDFAEFPKVPLIRVRNVNDAETLDALKKIEPSLTIVSGTNLVGKKVINASERIVNLHTGISPYVKGGPNCTNWCLARNWFHLIGNTVMWLDIGIDTGKIIATEQTPLNGRETLFELHYKVMEHAHDLYMRTVRRLAEGDSVPSVLQDDIDAGTLFYTADWNIFEMRKALKNFQANYQNYFTEPAEHAKLTAGLRLISLDEK